MPTDFVPATVLPTFSMLRFHNVFHGFLCGRRGRAQRRHLRLDLAGRTVESRRLSNPTSP